MSFAHLTEGFQSSFDPYTDSSHRMVTRSQYEINAAITKRTKSRFNFTRCSESFSIQVEDEILLPMWQPVRLLDHTTNHGNVESIMEQQIRPNDEIIIEPYLGADTYRGLQEETEIHSTLIRSVLSAILTADDAYEMDNNHGPDPIWVERNRLPPTPPPTPTPFPML